MILLIILGLSAYFAGGLIAYGLWEILIRCFGYEREVEFSLLTIISSPIIIPIATVVIFLEFVYWGIFRKRRLL